MPYFEGGPGVMLLQNAMQPQFFLKWDIRSVYWRIWAAGEGGSPESFSLSGQDVQISFELATDEMYKADLQEKGETIPQYMRASKGESEYIRE